METSLKQRLVGAITIFSLAVIFLPVIFDGSGESRLPDVNLDMPAQPRLTFDQYFENLLEGGKVGVKKLREEIDLADFDAGWVIQVGTFSREDNAKRQVAELMKNGHTAKYRKIDVDGSSRFVVDVGPEKDKQLLQAKADDIEADMKIRVRLREY